MDGNRRWARRRGLEPSYGHRVGADHVEELLHWCERWGIKHLSVYVLSADNIRKRSPNEITALFDLLATVIPAAIARSYRWTLHLSGQLDLLTSGPRQALEQAARSTTGRPCHVTMAIGYDAHADIVDAIRATLRSSTTDEIDTDSITTQLAGGPVKDIDLIIRTGGDHRVSGFFPWQSTNAEIYFTATTWPAFTERGFARALHHYARARRRTR